MVPFSCRSTATTSSPKRKVTPMSRRWYCSASVIWSSQKSSRRWRCSITVTLVPSAANMEAYSMPITPPPTTTSARGRCGSFRMPSESSTVESSNSTVFGRFGRVPTAITMLSAVMRRSSLPAVTATVCGSTKRASPCSICTWLRASWLRTTSTSRWITACVRQNRSSIVMSSLTW